MDRSRLLSRQTGAFSSPALRQITVEVEKVNGINLGQGVCNLPTPPLVIEAAHRAAKDGLNRYTNPRGLKSLREALSQKLRHFNGIEADPLGNIMISCGVTGAFEGVCGTLLDPGDEVVLFEPYYPYHVQALKRYQVEPRYVPLVAPDFEIDFDRLRSALSEKTKFVLINTPNNPTGKVFTQAELEAIGEVIAPYNCLLVSDEIYEYMTFDGRKHVSPASVPGLKDRTITMGGYSKTFAITGWRVGYAVAPNSIAGPMTAFLDAVYACPPAPLQEAVAVGIRDFGDDFYTDLNAKYEHKRNRFVSGLVDLGLEPLISEGAYYLICGFSKAFPSTPSSDFCLNMIRDCGVGAVPSSDFVRDMTSAPWVRFCMANEDDVLENALERLRHLRQTSQTG